MSVQQDLSIRSESVQRTYNHYVNNRLFVNRRYQRKLVWTVEEKISFIDSILKGYPVPIFLLAEVTFDGSKVFEILDGMQRLNAIMSFIENEFSFNDKYFDLNTMVESKSLFDRELIRQKTPIVDRSICEQFASYVLPLSVYSFDDTQKVDEIFRRINSNGKHLSKQELRSAGSLGLFANITRKLSSIIRTDVTPDDVLNLSKMKEISITNQDLDYGIRVDDIFWVKNYVLTKEMVRESRDEEIVADIVSYMALPEAPPTNSDVLDEFYGFSDLSEERFTELEVAIQKIGIERLHEHFIGTYNQIRDILSHSTRNFRDLIFKQKSQRLPRYFTIIFLAFYKLIYRQGMEVTNYDGLLKKLDGIAENINITTGGNWSSANKEDNINAVIGIIQPNFKKGESDDPGRYKWFTEFETLLMQAKVEQTLFDFKQGFIPLDGKNIFNESLFSKLIKTLTAMTNIQYGAVGYVCIGVADKAEDAVRIKSIFNVESIAYRGYYITGISHEAAALKMSLDKYYQKIVENVKSQPITEEAKMNILKNVRLISYFGKDILIFKSSSGDAPRPYADKYYIRFGANLSEVQPVDYPSFFGNYKAKHDF